MANILITGTNRGIGLATAIHLARAGHNVYATMRDPSKGSELADVAKKENLPIHISAMDVNSDTSVRTTIESIQKEKQIDVMINNAGIERRGSVEELPISDVRAVMETNYFGALRCIQAVMPAMRARRSGSIINISSVGGRVSSPPLTAYSASKFALEALCEGLAQEAKLFNVRVVIIEPGIINTDMAQHIGTEPSPSVYPQSLRMAALFAISLQQPTPPEIVAQKILEIIESDSWQLRYTVGPDAEGYINSRASMSDEQWVERGAVDDDTWYADMKNRFGVDPRQALRKA